MAASQLEEPPSTFPWYMKFFEYWRNRNRISPGRVELPDCDFFIVGPRRTLRILRPTLKSGWYYENSVNSERPESINDNFFTRWSRRPHSSGNCRCSFRRSSRLNSTTEEQLISAELNRIRTSLCEAEKTGQNIEELEKRLSVDLQKFQTAEVDNSGLNIDQNKTADQIDEQSIKNRIVKDLEKYINTLLEEILDDTVKFITGTEASQKSIKRAKNKVEKLSDVNSVSVHRQVDNNELNSETDHEECKTDHGITSGNEGIFNDISFSFHAGSDKQKVDQKIGSEISRGYVNQAFLGSTNDPDDLDFYLRQTAVGTQIVLDQLDCVDSGINSVETIEFQPDQETSLEQSLLRIIDEKFGRKTPPEGKWENSALPGFDVKECNLDKREYTKAKVKVSDKGTQCAKVDTAIAENLSSNDQCDGTPVSCVLTESLTTTGNSSVSESTVTDSVRDVDIQRKNDTSNKTDDQLITEIMHSDLSPQNDDTDRIIVDKDIVQQAKKSFLMSLSKKHQISSSSKTDKNSNISVENVEVKCLPSPKVLEETSTEPNFDNLRLVFNDISKDSSVKVQKTESGNCKMTKLREKLCANIDESSKALKRSWNDKMASFDVHRETSLPIELEDYRRKWPDLEETNPSISDESISNFVLCRENRKPTIVFLHGFGSSAEIFEHQLQYFSALGYPCIAPDMLGHGMSSAPGNARDYHFGKLLKDLDAVLHHYAFAPGQKCVLVAHNYGCSFATALACKYDTNIHQLVLISGGGPTPLAPPSTESAGHWCLRAILAPFLMCGLHRGILYSARGRQHPYCGPETPEQWPSHMKYILDGMIWSEGDYVFHRRICTPTLLVHGLRDNKVSLVQECQMERTMMKAFLEAMPAAGHSPMTDCPDQLNHMIHCFIDLWKNKKWQQ